MERINFVNNETKASAETFNLLQDNIENAIGDINQVFTNMKTVTLNNEWRNGFKPSGSRLFAEIPIFNPTGQQPTISITSAEVYAGSSWVSCTTSVRSYNTTELILELDNSASLTNGNVYLVRISGTITCQ